MCLATQEIELFQHNDVSYLLVKLWKGSHTGESWAHYTHTCRGVCEKVTGIKKTYQKVTQVKKKLQKKVEKKKSEKSCTNTPKRHTRANKKTKTKKQKKKTHTSNVVQNRVTLKQKDVCTSKRRKCCCSLIRGKSHSVSIVSSNAKRSTDANLHL